DEAGNDVSFKEKIVCYWSKKHYTKQVHENASFLKYLDEVAEKPYKIKKTPRKTDKFLKESLIDKKTGEELKNVAKKLSVNLSKVESYFELLGYYTIGNLQKLL
ncbi:MAG: hypothetical protein LBU04_06860, partial [Christensenellaceae bacterium]|nr:hypothetical protein [Christensenellaceae bacterium]